MGVMVDETFHPIVTVPRDGRVVLVAEEDTGVFAMRWNPQARNGLFPGVVGMWEAPDGAFTWQEHDGNGPSHWKAYAQ